MTLNKFAEKWKPELQRLAPKVFDAMVQDLAEMMKPPEAAVWVESVVSHRDLRPLVSVRMGPYNFQIAPSAAREIGLNFTGAAHAAEMDSYLFQFFSGEHGMPVDQVGQMVADFRRWREKHAEINEAAPAGSKQ